ncbi:unnamed protein product [Periconia digitata]|uniref:Zn(2)-C6 fungal-type domain-containing protein n=1 Tax=Periconia digitata TaxID=1303443 RepID=A0A9W4U879_9PLEO|nr:unnamed protein product [Periconia digitata]
MGDEAVAGLDTTRTPRARLTCAECHRRKTKCDKNVPCGTCIKRGISHLCCRKDAVLDSTNNRQGESEVTSNVVQVLLQRVANLEAQLTSAQTQAPLGANVDVHGHNSSSTATEQVVENTTSLSDPTACETATVLEFLAWGRKKVVDFGHETDHYSGPGQSGNETSTTDFFTESTKSAQLDMLEALLPSKEMISKLVDYHNSSILWYHGSYSSTVFSEHLDSFLIDFAGNIRHERLQIQWLALLFAILTGSLTCASTVTRQDWGFSDLEATSLSLRWYEATVTCLNMSEYIEKHTIHAVQAIATLTIAAHVLGKSSSQSILLGSAGRIAQSLGLHKLAPESQPLDPNQLRRREVGRRVYIQLCTQDWFQIPFSDTFTHNPKFATTAKPLNCNDDDMVVRDSSIPTQASYCNFRYDIAALMPQLLEAMAGCNALYTKYEQVMKYDAKMRDLATASIPIFLSKNGPVDTEWPRYISWARRSLTICASHKIMMIHRRFLVLSFTNSAFVFTRRTCIAASKTILREVLAPIEADAPVLWIEQAFAIAAGIILSLDALHRRPDEPEFSENGKLIRETISHLRQFKESKIATRGVELLSALEHEINVAVMESRKRQYPTDDGGEAPAPKRRALDVHKLLKDISHNLEVSTAVATPGSSALANVNETMWDNLTNLFPIQTGFDAQYLFDDLFPPLL